MIRPKSTLSSEVDKRISCQQLQNSGPVAKTFSLRCLVPRKLEQDIDKALTWLSSILSSAEEVRLRRLLLSSPLRHIGQAPSPKHLAISRGLIDQLWSRKLDSTGTNTDQDLDVYAIAEALEDSGVTKDSVILVWHSTYYDLTLLGNFLESAGANSPLPSRANYVRLVPHVRANVPSHNGKPFPATLSTIFPILFPRHELVGHNHRALVDCHQTRLVMTAYEEFAKPIGSPGRLEFFDIKPTQQTLDN
jgi:hypothetical protein